MKKPTMLDIANQVGVTKATVSMVLNKKDELISPETRDKILKVADELGYIPNSFARSLITKKSGTIGIIIPDITNPFFAEIARAIEDEANRLQYNVIFCNTDNQVPKEESAIRLLIGKLVDGVIFIAGGTSETSLALLNQHAVSFVLVDRYIPGCEDYPGVYCMSDDGVMDGVRHLYEKGRRKIAYVRGPRELRVFEYRVNAYKEMMTTLGIYDERYVYEVLPSLEAGIAVTEQIARDVPDVDGIIYCNDMTAMGGLKALTRLGYHVPRDISIIGYDNIKISQFIEPELTTVAQPIAEMGEAACNLLINIINEVPLKEQKIFLYAELVVRGTS
ncbi:LacI family transcriptional regulator [Paenibacillus pectinilyticus]|uniref:LacI family transcriptional regulator n=1 Tax=Paenibacillus pectinilyticus TaxID=512399 RepID=A0A1C1A2S6_9BACL|nr:LacI family transcriptional regulator [Paenibacillus pectinilyticus]